MTGCCGPYSCSASPLTRQISERSLPISFRVLTEFRMMSCPGPKIYLNLSDFDFRDFFVSMALKVYDIARVEGIVLKLSHEAKTRECLRTELDQKISDLISDLRNVKPNAEEILIWTLPEILSGDILNALNNFRELFYDAGVPSLVFLTPAELDDVVWKAPDFWRYRGGYHILKGEDYGQAYQAVEALSIPLNFSYQNKEDLLRRKRINEHLLEKIKNKSEKVRILIELATIHSLLSDQRKAIECARAAIRVREEIEDPRTEKTRRKLQEWVGLHQKQ